MSDVEAPPESEQLMATGDSVQRADSEAPHKKLRSVDRNNNISQTDRSQVFPLSTSSQMDQEESAESRDITAGGLKRDKSSRRSETPLDALPIAPPNSPQSSAEFFAGENHADGGESDIDSTLDEEISIDYSLSAESCPSPTEDFSDDDANDLQQNMVLTSGVAPVQAKGETPVQAGDADLFQVGSVTPGRMTPMQGDVVAQVQEGATPVQAESVTPVQAEDKNQLEYRKNYWNFILTTYFTKLNEIESNKVDIETVEFHEMLVEIYEFDKSAAWTTYERWTVPTLIKKLLGPMTTWEELNDTQHQFCRALNSLSDQEVYKNSVKKVLAYLHNLLNISVEPRPLYRLSNEFESDVWDWMLCNYQTNVEKYVVAQEEIRGTLSSNLDYSTFPAFVERLEFYSKCKNKDADSAFLYECYAFFEEHVHIQREVLSDDFQKMFTQPEDSLKDVEMEYFQRVLGLVNKMIVF